MEQNLYEKAKKETYEKVKIHQLINFDKKPEQVVKVSIIIPVCNVEQYLRECLDSAVNQTLQEIEIICVNDGSTDGSLEILKEYAGKDDRVKIIDKDNAGYGHTMNIGMDMAKGEYIGIIESDDYVDLNMYEDLYKLAEENQVDFIKADFYRFITTDNDEKMLTRINVGYQKYYNKVLNPSKNGELFKLNMQTWTGIYRRDYLNSYIIRHNETPGASFQDNGFYFKTYCWAKRIYLVNQPYYMYRFDNTNSSVNNKEKTYCIKEEFDLIYSYLLQFEELPENSINLFYWKKYKSYLFNLTRLRQELKKEFLETFSDEFRKVREIGGLKEELFTKQDWRIINWIIDEPEDYYEHRVKRPKISVLVPAYNVEPYLRQCLDSVLNQTLDFFEVICIDDGSKDQTLKILREYEEKNKNVIVYNQGNIGVGKTRNKAIDYAKGEFIIFIDPDDWYPENDILETLYNAAKEHDVKICGGSFSDYTVDGRVLTDYKGTLTGYTFLEDKVMNYSEYQFDFGFHRFIYDREMIKQNKIYFPEYVRFQDPPFFIKAMICAEKFYAMKKVVYRYRRPSANKVNWDIKKTTDLLLALKDDLEISSENKLAKLHLLTLRRFDVRYFEPILKNVSVGKEKIFTLIEQIAKTIDHSLLETINADVSEYYLYELLIQKSIKTNERLIVENEAYIKKIGRMESNSVCNAINQLNTTLGTMLESNELVDKLEMNRLRNDRFCLNEIRCSFSYKIGLFITWIPRTVRKIVKKQ